MAAAAGNDTVYVRSLREEVSSAHDLDLCIVADNVRKGAVLSSIQIAQILVKDYLG
jgi:aspartate-semialdehyde dehydrogenase